LGDMVQALGQNGLQVPDGFAATVDAYRLFLNRNSLEDPIPGPRT